MKLADAEVEKISSFEVNEDAYPWEYICRICKEQATTRLIRAAKFPDSTFGDIHYYCQRHGERVAAWMKPEKDGSALQAEK